MEGESPEPEEALRGKVLLLLHAPELGKDAPAHTEGCSFVDFGFGSEWIWLLQSQVKRFR